MADHHLILILHAHLPFIRHPELTESIEERKLFEVITESLLPMLEVFDRLESDQIPFKLVMSISPTLSAMLADDLLCNRYIDYLDRLIKLGAREAERTRGDAFRHPLARQYYNQALENRVAFVERHDRDLLKAFDFYHKKGRLELWTTAATHAILPFLNSKPEAVQAQIEIALAMHRQHFGRSPQGFWLPEMAWFSGIDNYLRAYGIAYSVVEAHGLLFADPPPLSGTFKPVRTAAGLAVFSRDPVATAEITDPETGLAFDGVFRSDYGDIAFDLEAEDLTDFLSAGGVRTESGFKYCCRGQGLKTGTFYDPAVAHAKVTAAAAKFLNSRLERAAAAQPYLEGDSLAVCAFAVEFFGQTWYEGPDFIEQLFRQAVQLPGLQFSLPQELVAEGQPLETIEPEFSTWHNEGYAENWLDASNDWMYRHIIGSVSRMIEMAERFPDDGGLKERALNQAVRELLLAQASDWALAMKEKRSPEYAKRRVEESIRNFNHIYESLGGNYISTEWLTTLEKRHNLFQGINYRIFRRKC